MSPRRLFAALAFLATSLVLVAPSSPAQAATKDPVIVVPGFTTGPIVSVGYLPLVERLRNAGYDVTLLVYPDYGLGDINANAQRLANTVASVRARTGAAKVDLVAHSMGGLVSRTYVKNLGGSTKVDSLITDDVFGTEHGIALDPATTHVFLCGNPAMIGLPEEVDGAVTYPETTGVVELLAARGFTLDHRNQRGNIHFEEYW